MNEQHLLALIKRMPTIVGERVILRRLSVKDAPDVYEYSSNPRCTKYLSWSEHESVAYTKSYLKYATKRYKSGDYTEWGIVLKATGKVIGTCGYTSVDASNNSAEIGYVLNPDYQKMGYGIESVKLIIDYSFRELELNRLTARVFPQNLPSIRLLERLSFTCEGRGKREALIKGEYRDILHYALCREDEKGE